MSRASPAQCHPVSVSIVCSDEGKFKHIETQVHVFVKLTVGSDSQLTTTRNGLKVFYSGYSSNTFYSGGYSSNTSLSFLTSFDFLRICYKVVGGNLGSKSAVVLPILVQFLWEIECYFQLLFLVGFCVEIFSKVE